MLIYRIFLPHEWDEFESAGQFSGSPFDHSCGFIHCSSREQVARTAALVFSGEPALVVAALDTRQLGDSVRYEEADGELFPHVYAAVPVSAVAAVYRVAGAASVDAALPRQA